MIDWFTEAGSRIIGLPSGRALQTAASVKMFYNVSLYDVILSEGLRNSLIYETRKY